MINDQRVVSVGKEVSERHIGHVYRVILAEIGCPFAKNIVRDAPPRWQSTTHLRHALHLVLQRDLRGEQLFPAPPVIIALTRKNKARHWWFSFLRPTSPSS
jgi:hypothetical protein